MRVLMVWAVFLLLVSTGGTARAEDTALQERVQQLELMVQDLQREIQQPRSVKPGGGVYGGSSLMPAVGAADIPAWVTRFRLSGNADISYRAGQRDTTFKEANWGIDNARLFFDVDLGWEGKHRGRSLFDSASFYFEWDIIRQAVVENDVGSMYLRMDSLMGVPWLNLKLGRMPIAFGHEYLRFHEGRPNNPFLTFTAGMPYGWDEGVQLFGSFGEGDLSYVVSIANGDYDKSGNSDSGLQGTVKLIAQPANWLKLTASGIHTGQVVVGAFKLGGTKLYTVGFPGTGSAIAYQDGALATDPSRTLDTTDAWELDAVLTSGEFGQLWLSYGKGYLRASSNGNFDRAFTWGVLEGVLELGALSPALAAFYLAGRYSTIGTFDSDEGYKFEVMNTGDDLGYNVNHVDIISVAMGFRLTERLTLKAEYSWFDFELVHGVTSTIKNDANQRDLYGIGMSIDF